MDVNNSDLLWKVLDTLQTTTRETLNKTENGGKIVTS